MTLPRARRSAALDLCLPVFVVLLAAACTSGDGNSGSAPPPAPPPPPPAAVASISLAPDGSTVTAGSTVQLTVTTRAADGTVLTGRTVQWTSSADSVATVSTQGVVTAGALGRATITATSEGISATTFLRVVPQADVLAGDPASSAVAAIPLLSLPPMDPADYSTGSPELPNAEVSIRDAMLRISPDATLGQLNAVLQLSHAKVVAGSPGVPGDVPGLIVLRLPTESHAEMAAALATLRAQPIVMQAQPDMRVGTHVVTSSRNVKEIYPWTWQLKPDTSNWGLEAVRAPALWNLNDTVRRSGNRTLTAVFDAGFYPSEDLEYERQLEPEYTNTHGVHVAGILAGTFGNGIGIDGMSPFVRLVTAGGFETTTALTTDFRKFFEELSEDVEPPGDIRVINVSLGYNTGDHGEDTRGEAGLEYRRRADADGNHVLDTLRAIGAERALPVVVVSGGNDSNSFPDQDVRYASPYANAAVRGAAPIIVVESVENDFSTGTQKRSDFSNQGGHVSAPGSAILGPLGSTDYDVKNGTSQAAPHVAGLVSYLYALAPTLPAPTMASNPIRDLVVRTARRIDGVAPMLDAFAAALEVDRELGNENVLRALVDIDDGTVDGNVRVGVAEGTDDFDADGGVGDGAIDMSDFRRWRDWYLQVQDDASLALDGPATHRKRDLNGDGVVETPAKENVHPRGDLNGDGKIDLESTAPMPGALAGREYTDLGVLQSRFSDPHYDRGMLPDLLESFDLNVDVRGCLLRDGVAGVLVEIEEVAHPGVTLRSRTVRSGVTGPETFTEKVVAEGHRVKVSALNVAGVKEGHTESRVFTLERGADASYVTTCEAGTVRNTVSISPGGDPSCTLFQEIVSERVAALSISRECTVFGVQWRLQAENFSVIGRGQLLGVSHRTRAPSAYAAGTASGYQRIIDFVTIDAPGRDGEVGTVTVNMEIAGTLSATGSCSDSDVTSATFMLSGSVVSEGRGQSLFGGTRRIIRYPCIAPGTELPTILSGTLSFTYGVPFSMQYEISATGASVTRSDGSDSEGRAEMAEFHWLGMTGLPEEAMVSSSLGVNWKEPIP